MEIEHVLQEFKNSIEEKFKHIEGILETNYHNTDSKIDDINDKIKEMLKKHEEDHDELVKLKVGCENKQKEYCEVSKNIDDFKTFKTKVNFILKVMGVILTAIIVAVIKKYIN